MTITLTDERLDKTKHAQMAFHKVEFSGREYQVVKFDVLVGWVSFHHSLHWLLAELLKHTRLLGRAALRPLGYEDLRSALLDAASEQAILTLVDFPLRGDFTALVF